MDHKEILRHVDHTLLRRKNIIRLPSAFRPAM